MPTEVIHTVGTGGDYSTLSAWEAAQQRDLVAADGIAVAEITGTVSGAAEIDGWNTDGTRLIKIRAKPGEEHGGIFGAGAKLISSATNATLYLREFVEVSQLEIENTGTGSIYQCPVWTYVFDDGYTANLIDLLLVGNNNTSSNSAGVYIGNRSSTVNIYTSIAKNCGGAAFYPTGATVTVNIYNSVAINCNTSNNAFRGGINANVAGTTIRNCVAINNNTADFFGTGATVDHNASSDATASGTGSITSVTTAEFADYAGGDYHLASDSQLIGAGTDLSGTFTTDIDGDTISTWMIGADFYVASGTTITGTPQLQTLTASGSVQVGDTVTVNGSPQLQALTANGTIDLSSLVNGSPQLQALAASGTVTVKHTITGTPQLQALTASGVIQTADGPVIVGTPQLQSLTASGSIGLSSVITGTPQLQNLTAAGSMGAQIDVVQIIGQSVTIARSVASSQIIDRTLTQTGRLS